MSYMSVASLKMVNIIFKSFLSVEGAMHILWKVILMDVLIPFNPIVPNWLKVAFQLDTMEYLCHTKVQVPLFPQCRMALCPSCLVVITMSTAPSFGSAVFSVTKRHARVGLNSYQRVPFHDQTWTPMRENIFWQKSLLIAGLTCP